MAPSAFLFSPPRTTSIRRPRPGHGIAPQATQKLSDRSTLLPMEPIHTLLATPPISPSEGVLPEDLRARYGGDLSFPPAPEQRPYCIANFVSTLDGVVSFNLPGQSGGDQISHANEEDRFTMGLLRASVDAILVGPGTLLATGPEGAWLPESVYPAAKESYKKYRTEVLQKPEYPLVVIVTGSGELDLASAVFHTPQTRVLILTTEQGKEKLSQSGSQALASVEVKALPASGKGVAPSAIFTWLRHQAGVELLLHEAGPTLFGQFLAAELPADEIPAAEFPAAGYPAVGFPAAGYIDELFLTVAPQIAGRSPEHPRPGLVEKTQFSPATAPWWKLISVRNAADYLFLRYRRSLP